ncbi:hypothetical protein O9G_000165 [Rozella allomycis CSF55]|uniref:Uncharacterized protein n=1 Tax=Rozella allomycis (strain CSF55) TaxID=988480 RepID=A0A075ASK2_ROZAC|nr:hypothetical protein O9G_000165 [Rozella allomycis CSF55]|eukprot:EPZ31686.1 hypothetical protein O9G_000165 [Rozella allomycis CSF55]
MTVFKNLDDHQVTRQEIKEDLKNKGLDIFLKDAKGIQSRNGYFFDMPNDEMLFAKQNILQDLLEGLLNDMWKGGVDKSCIDKIYDMVANLLINLICNLTKQIPDVLIYQVKKSIEKNYVLLDRKDTEVIMKSISNTVLKVIKLIKFVFTESTNLTITNVDIKSSPFTFPSLKSSMRLAEYNDWKIAQAKANEAKNENGTLKKNSRPNTPKEKDLNKNSKAKENNKKVRPEDAATNLETAKPPSLTPQLPVKGTLKTQKSTVGLMSTKDNEDKMILNKPEVPVPITTLPIEQIFQNEITNVLDEKLSISSFSDILSRALDYEVNKIICGVEAKLSQE